MSDLKQLLAELGLEQYHVLLSENGIDLAVLPDLTDQDLTQLGLLLGHRRKLMAAAAKLRATPDAAAPAAALPSAAGPTPQAERRQVTVLFSDLVGSTSLSTQLDPEDLSRVLRGYQDTCAGVIARHDGFLAKFLGDGVLAYFGYPLSNEDEALVAVRAGLEIVEAVSGIRLPDGHSLQTRVGLATGTVVVGEIIGSGASQEHAIIGDTPNLAARLQALAEPGTVVISPSTYSLLGEAFEVASLGHHELKGFSEPIYVRRVMSERVADSRFAAAHSALGPLVGRDAELSALLACWQEASQGHGRAVLLSGEAGMGKSRLLQSLSQHVRAEPHRRVLCQCSPFHSSTALYPVLRTLERAAGMVPADEPPARLAKLEALLAQAGPPVRRQVLLLAEMLVIATEEQIPASEMTAAQHKTEGLKALANHLVRMAADAPLLLLLEDAHWMDPTTQDLVSRLLERLDGARLLVVITFRPEFTAPWKQFAPVTSLVCTRLGGTHCEAMVRHILAQQGLPAGLVSEIIRRSDGVPLYVEELTKAVIESGTGQTSKVPSTLQDSLMARLDRLGAAKDVAQTAAVLGRQFNFTLLASIVSIGEPELHATLGQLVQAELIFPQGADGTYLFKHALIQQAAYESLLRTRRQVLHGQIAHVLEARFSDLATREPELLAHHYSLAGQAEPASKYWERAAEQAVARVSYAEAVASLNAALQESAKVPRSGIPGQAAPGIAGQAWTHAVCPQGVG